jgi:hypothetical protein
MLRRVTEPFVTTRNVGVGLGLTIVKKIVERHSGRLLMDSMLGRGSTMTVLLTVAMQAHPEDKLLAQLAKSGAGEFVSGEWRRVITSRPTRERKRRRLRRVSFFRTLREFFVHETEPERGLPTLGTDGESKAAFGFLPAPRVVEVGAPRVQAVMEFARAGLGGNGLPSLRLSEPVPKHAVQAANAPRPPARTRHFRSVEHIRLAQALVAKREHGFAVEA